ncbi:MAG: histidine phosphatase family protein [Elainellaceae cyanobacterium]
MIFFKSKHRWIAWVLLLSIAGCTGNPLPSEAPAEIGAPAQTETVAQPAPEPASEPTADPEPTAQAEADIWSQLREADTHYYVLMRHAIAPGTGDPPGFEIGDCSTQRNLSEEGRAQARRTGEAFREKNIAVQQVLSSEWCRCLDTAVQLDLGAVESFPPLNSFFENRARGPEQTERLREFMLDHQGAQQVTVMVTHFVNISAIAGSGVSSGEMVVIRANQDQLEVVERIEEF